jgi:hypothetical protein
MMKSAKSARNSGGRNASFFCNLFNSGHLFTSFATVSARNPAKTSARTEKYGKGAVISNTTHQTGVDCSS